VDHAWVVLLLLVLDYGRIVLNCAIVETLTALLSEFQGLRRLRAHLRHQVVGVVGFRSQARARRWSLFHNVRVIWLSCMEEALAGRRGLAIVGINVSHSSLQASDLDILLTQLVSEGGSSIESLAATVLRMHRERVLTVHL